ncbi:MAG: DUF6524 family protein [Gammaproteobacteria bacterium]|nr:DUF6524 family protein [Gammaproteobacteria bacterium]
MQFTFSSFGLRFMFAAILVFATYNPEGYSYFAWVRENFPSVTLEQAFVGTLLTIGWIIFLRATFRSLGIIGLILAFTLFGLLFALLFKWGWLSLEMSRLVTYIAEVLLAVILALGMSWSHIRRRLAGQMDMDDVDEE